MEKCKPSIHYKPCVEGIVLAKREESSKSSASVEPVIPIIILYEMSCYIDECISNSCVGMYVAIGCDIQNQKLEVYEEMIVLFPYQGLEIRDIEKYGRHTDRNPELSN